MLRQWSRPGAAPRGGAPSRAPGGLTSVGRGRSRDLAKFAAAAGVDLGAAMQEVEALTRRLVLLIARMTGGGDRSKFLESVDHHLLTGKPLDPIEEPKPTVRHGNVIPIRRAQKRPFVGESAGALSLRALHFDLTGVLPRLGRYSACLRLPVDVSPTFRFRQRLLWRFLVGGPPAIKRSIGHGDRTPPRRDTRQVRVFGPGYNRSSKWLVAP